MKMVRFRRGFSLLELVVVLVVALVLIGTLFSVLTRYHEIVERDMVDINIRNIRNGIRLHVAQLLLAGRQRELSALVGANPIPWLGVNLPDYIGEYDGAPPPELRGCWFFDRSRNVLVFRPKSPRLIAGAPVEPSWQVILSGGQDSGVKLVEVEVK